MTWRATITAPHGDLILNHEHDGFHSPDDALAWVAKSYDFLHADRVTIELAPQDDGIVRNGIADDYLP